MIRYDTGVRKRALEMELCRKVESVIGDFDPKRAESDDFDKSTKLPEHAAHQFSKESSEEESTLESTLESIMKTRGRLLQKTCKIEYFIRTLKYLKLEFPELKQIQTFVVSGNMDKMESLRLKLEENETANEPTVPSKPEMVRSIFLVDDFNMLTCLPLKTGTTNWQRTLTSLLYVKKTGRYLSPENVTSVFSLVPRYYSSFNDYYFRSKNHDRYKNVSQCIKQGLDTRRNDTNMIRWMNVRHPLSRLLSAWRNKFAKSFYKSKKFVGSYGDKIKEFTTDDDYLHEDYHVPFTSFLKFVIWSWQNDWQSYVNTHWVTYFKACSPCVMKYKYIAKQESSYADANFLLQKTGLQNKTYLPGQYEDSLLMEMTTVDWYQNVSDEVIQQLYISYFPDFLMYNYTVDEYLNRATTAL